MGTETQEMGAVPRRDRYDAVVVGGGHNGLVAAAYLARAGQSVLVLERGERPGGAAASARAFPGVDARLSRYAYLVSLLPGRIREELGLRVELRPRRIACYAPDPRADGRRGLLIDSADPARTQASMAAVSDGDEDLHAGWERLYGLTGLAARRLAPTLLEPLRSRAALRDALGDDAAWRLLFEAPIADGLEALLPDTLVRGVALTDALIGTFARAGDEDLAQNRCFLYHVIGDGTGLWKVPVGGMGAVTEELAERARAFGAEIRCGAEVTAIATAGDRATVAFLDEAGEEREVRGDRVLAGVGRAVLDRLRGREPSERPEGAQLKVNLVVDRLPRLRDERVDPRDAFAGTFHVNQTADQLDAAWAAASAGRIPDLVPCEVYCHSLTDPSILGPELRNRGAHTLTAFAVQLPARLFAEDPEGRRAEAVQRTLRSLDAVLAEPVDDCLARDADGRPCLEAKSPVDLEAELGLPGGNIFQGPLAWPYAEEPGEEGTWGVETDDPAVLLCGASARRGGGVSGIPGRNAAMAVLGG